jgi:hypothetical protein
MKLNLKSRCIDDGRKPLVQYSTEAAMHSMFGSEVVQHLDALKCNAEVYVAIRQL